MPLISTLSLWVAAAIALLEAFGRLTYPVTWGTTTFDGALALAGAICLAHGISRLRRRSAMGSMRLGSSH